MGGWWRSGRVGHDVLVELDTDGSELGKGMADA